MKNKTALIKIKKYSHNLGIVMNAFYWVSIVVTCISLIATIVLNFISDEHFILNEKSIGHLGYSLDGLIRYNIKDITLLGINMKNTYITIALMAGLLCILLIPFFKQLALVLRTVEEDKPFARENSNRITTFGIIFIIGSLSFPLAQVLVANSMIENLGLQNLSTNYSINLALLFSGFMMIILGGIFKYGSYLQHEYDETV